MNVEFRLPHLTAPDPAGQIRQLHSFLRQTVEQLNFVLSQNRETQVLSAARTAPSPKPDRSAADAFQAMKGLIIKSADIVHAYYTQIDALLKTGGEYVASGAFGTYREQTQQLLTANQNSISQLNQHLQALNGALKQVQAYVRSGYLWEQEGVPVYGVEVGQTNLENGVEVFRKFARFTADRLSFYDQRGQEVAYISDTRLHITNIDVLGGFSQGGFFTAPTENGSLVTKWIGGDSL